MGDYYKIYDVRACCNVSSILFFLSEFGGLHAELAEAGQPSRDHLRALGAAADGQVAAVRPTPGRLGDHCRQLSRHCETRGADEQALPQGDGLAAQTGGSQADVVGVRTCARACRRWRVRVSLRPGVNDHFGIGARA